MRIVVSGRMPENMRRALENLGLEPVGLPMYARLDGPVADHSDMLLYRRRDGALVTWGEYCRQNRSLFDGLGCGLMLEANPPSAAYPNDVALNALRMGDCLFGRLDALSPLVQDDCCRGIAVKQGYARCSVLAPDDCHAITADPSLASALERDGREVVRISAGHILLPGYDCGFIGGASAVWGKQVLFFGRLNGHPDRKIIVEALEGWGFSWLELGDFPLTDLGGGLIL